MNTGSNQEPNLPYGGFTEGVHLFPFRTEQLSPSWPMVLGHNPGRVGSRRLIDPAKYLAGFFLPNIFVKTIEFVLLPFFKSKMFVLIVNLFKPSEL